MKQIKGKLSFLRHEPIAVLKVYQLKQKKQHEYSKEIGSGSTSGKAIIPPEKLIKIIAPLKRHKSNKSNKKIDNGEEE